MRLMRWRGWPREGRCGQESNGRGRNWSEEGGIDRNRVVLVKRGRIKKVAGRRRDTGAGM